MLHYGTCLVRRALIHTLKMANKITRCRVDEAVLARWEARFTEYASISWVLETAMIEVLDEVEKDPTLADVVRRAIRARVTKLRLENQDA